MRIWSGAAALVLVAAGCGETTGPELRLDGTVRVLHAAPETPRLEVMLDGTSQTLLEYAEVSDRVTVPIGVRRLQIFIAGDTEPLIDLDTLFAEATQYTVIAAGRPGSIVPIMLVDDPMPADSGQTRIRLVHAAPTAGVVDIYVTEPGVALSTAAPDLTAVAFGEASDYMVLEARTYQVRVAVAGSSDLLIDLPLLVLSSTRVLTIVIMDTMGSGPPHGLIVLNDEPR